MTIDNSTQSVTAIKSGTGWTMDVTLCNLDKNTSLKDFIVTFDGVDQNNADFTKLSSTSIQYTGASIGSTEVTVYRNTPLERVQEVKYNDRMYSTLWENEFNRVHKVLYDRIVSSRLDSITLGSSPSPTSDSLAVPTTAWVRDRIGNWDENFAINTNKFNVAYATGNTTIAGTLGVTGATTLSSTLGVTGNFAINTNRFNVTASNGNTTIAGTLGVTGATTLNSTLGVIGDFAINTNRFNVTASNGNTTVAGTLGVTGATTLSSTLGVTGDFAVNTNRFNITASNGNTTIAGTLGVAGATTLSSTLSVTGTTTLGAMSATSITSSESIAQANDSTTVPTTAWVNDKIAAIAKIQLGRLSNHATDYLLNNNLNHNSNTIYFHRHCGENIALFDGTNWQVYSIAASPVSISLASGYTSKLVDIFAYASGSTVTLEATAWTNDNTRATALATQNGVLVRSGAATRRYLGTVYVSSDNTVYMRKRHKTGGAAAEARCHIVNCDNKIVEPFTASDTSMTTDVLTADSSWRQYAGVAVSFLSGIASSTVDNNCPTVRINAKMSLSVGAWSGANNVLVAVGVWNNISNSVVSDISPGSGMLGTGGSNAVSPMANDSIQPLSGRNAYSLAYYAQPNAGTPTVNNTNRYYASIGAMLAW